MKEFDSKAFGREVKKDRLKEHEPRREAAKEANITPHHLMEVENYGQPPSLRLMSSLCKRFDISADQFIFPKDNTRKGVMRRQIAHEIDELKEKDLPRVESTINRIRKSEKR